MKISELIEEALGRGICVGFAPAGRGKQASIWLTNSKNGESKSYPIDWTRPLKSELAYALAVSCAAWGVQWPYIAPAQGRDGKAGVL